MLEEMGLGTELATTGADLVTTQGTGQGAGQGAGQTTTRPGLVEVTASVTTEPNPGRDSLGPVVSSVNLDPGAGPGAGEEGGLPAGLAHIIPALQGQIFDKLNQSGIVPSFDAADLTTDIEDDTVLIFQDVVVGPTGELLNITTTSNLPGLLTGGGQGLGQGPDKEKNEGISTSPLPGHETGTAVQGAGQGATADTSPVPHSAVQHSEEGSGASGGGGGGYTQLGVGRETTETATPPSSPTTQPTPPSSPTTQATPSSSQSAQRTPPSSSETEPTPPSSLATQPTLPSLPATQPTPPSSPATQPTLPSSAFTRTPTSSSFTTQQWPTVLSLFTQATTDSSLDTQSTEYSSFSSEITSPDFALTGTTGVQDTGGERPAGKPAAPDSPARPADNQAGGPGAGPGQDTKHNSQPSNLSGEQESSQPGAEQITTLHSGQITAQPDSDREAGTRSGTEQAEKVTTEPSWGELRPDTELGPGSDTATELDADPVAGTLEAADQGMGTLEAGTGGLPRRVEVGERRQNISLCFGLFVCRQPRSAAAWTGWRTGRGPGRWTATTPARACACWPPSAWRARGAGRSRTGRGAASCTGSATLTPTPPSSPSPAGSLSASAGWRSCCASWTGPATAPSTAATPATNNV